MISESNRPGCDGKRPDIVPVAVPILILDGLGHGMPPHHKIVTQGGVYGWVRKASVTRRLFLTRVPANEI